MVSCSRADGHPVVLIQRSDFFTRLHAKLLGRLPMWVIYRPVTVEYPGRWVARMHVTLPVYRSTRFVMTHDTLGELRAMLPPQLMMLARHSHDAPEIEEVWL
jgi:hypothetical protein